MLFAGLGLAQSAPVAEKKPATPEALKAELDAEKLIQQLSLKEPAKAEEARDRLLKLGPTNLPALDEQIYKDANAKLCENFVDISLHSMQTAPEIRQVLDAFHPLEGTNDPFQHQSHP